MPSLNISTFVITLAAFVLLLPSPVSAFGAGNIASISAIEGKNWRHGDIEDVLKTIAFLHGRKWTSTMIKRTYFGNWLRDYSQAVDVGTLKGIQADTIRILVWVLSFMSFGYATAEFEVTSDRLGVYNPHEHIDNPKDYADNVDARQYDPRLRPPVRPEELAIDPQTGMKNYISNEYGGWATSSGYIKFSLARSIHYGRLYTSGSSGTRGNDADLCEALRCLGQALHCLEDFSAHSNYTELALIDMGFRDVFPYSGSGTMINIYGRHVYPLVTGTFGAVDFFHSVLGEATDHFTQSEVAEMDNALLTAQAQTKPSTSRGSTAPAHGVNSLTGLLSQMPGGMGGSLCQEAERLQAQADAQERINREGGQSTAQQSYAAPPGSVGGPPAPGVPGMDPTFDPAKTIASIYPILEFRDKVARMISATVEKIPGLQALCEKISEHVTVFVLSLLAPFIRPIIDAVSKQLQAGSSTVVDASGRHQFEVWTDPTCSDPTHSLLSKDHFSNVLNEIAGKIAASVLQYVAPRIIYAWENPGVPVDQVLNDVVRVLHHPALRDRNSEVHGLMYDTVRRWVDGRPDRGASFNHILGSESVRAGKNHSGDAHQPHQAHLPHQSHQPHQLHQSHQSYQSHQPHQHGGSATHGSSGLGGFGQFGGAGFSKLFSSGMDSFGLRRDDVSRDQPTAGGEYYPQEQQQYQSAPYAGAAPNPGPYQSQNAGGYDAPPYYHGGHG
ncbi:MAG: hypothetical protein M1833_000771 [Piccolia ochrophora]|nr:MAG: hypothetical protein M1833_000771 [Piccolia ochrophora]